MSLAQSGWPALKRYEGDCLRMIAMPLGGVGAGSVSLGGRGNLRDWEVMNHPAKGFSPPYSFFALYAKPAGGAAVARVLEGRQLPPHEDSHGFRATAYGLPRFRHCSFAAAYPFAQVRLADPAVPVEVRLEAFSPFIPADADRSGAPVAVLRYVLTNKTRRAVQSTVCGAIENFIGDGAGAQAQGGFGRLSASGKGKVNRFRKSAGRAPVQGVALSFDGLAPSQPQFGTLALATTARAGVTARTAWAAAAQGFGLYDFWRDLATDGRLDARSANPRMASLAVSVSIPPRASRAVTFLLAWHFPNRQTWAPRDRTDDTIGNYYATRYRDAWDVAAKTAAALPVLERDTLAFVRAFCDSDLPAAVKEAALFNLSTLCTQTCFRTPDGRFFGWEGCSDAAGCCAGSCTHVWSYEPATAHLFGALARSMREVEFLFGTGDDGYMRFRVDLPLTRRRAAGLLDVAAIDGQMGCVVRLYREWRLCGDDDWLRRLWPACRKAIEFCWIPGGWDADRDGVAEGAQHTTTDFEYFGPNPVGGVCYLAGLRAAEEMARRLGEGEFAAECRRLFDSGSRWIDARLFNGEYYIQDVRPPRDRESIAPRLVGRMIRDLKQPEMQIGDGCQSDQLLGQYHAHVCGLGQLLDPARVRRTLRSVMKYNFRVRLEDYPAYFRTFALNDESGLLFGSYPKGEPPQPNFRFSELWTGTEYAVAAHLIYEGLAAQGLRVIEAIRARYDGRKRNPFDECECGHHYARAMASWAAVLALIGFQYCAAEGEMEFTASPGPAQWFWSTGDAWGVFRQRPLRRRVRMELHVLGGSVALRRLALTGVGAAELPRMRKLGAGQCMKLDIRI